MEPYESPVERAIREARERGEFDNLPGAGRPLPPIDPHDPDWFVKRLAAREGVDLSGAMSPTMALRKEAQGFPESLLELRTEESVRAVLTDFNRRVKLDRLRPAVGREMPPIAPTVDVEDLLARWRVLRATSDAARPAPPGAARPRTRGDRDDEGERAASGLVRRPARGAWWRRVLGRGQDRAHD